MTLPTMLPHGRREALAWCRAIDEGPWSSLAVPERITYTSHALTVQLAAAAALTERVRLATTSPKIAFIRDITEVRAAHGAKSVVDRAGVT